MKKLLLGLSILVVLLISTLSASAALVLGSTSQEASIDDEDINKYTTKTFTLTGIAATSTCTFSPVDNYINSASGEKKNNLNITYVTASGTLKVTARVPESLDAVDESTLNENSFQVADISCSGGVSETLEIRRMNMLEIDEIEADFGTDIETLNDDGDELEDLDAGDTLSLEVFIDNLYDNDDNVDIDTDVTIECDSDIDVDDESDNVEIGADDKDSVIFDLTLDEDDVTDSTYTCVITVTGTDDFGAIHGEEWTIKLDVSKENYEVKVKEMSLSPTAVTCTNREVTASVKIKNTGKKNDDEVKLELVSSKLSLLKSIIDIDLNDGDSTRKVFTFSVPDDLVSGTYEIIAKTYSKGLSLSDQHSVSLVVPDCGQDPTPVVTPPPVVVTPPPVVVTPPPSTGGDDDDDDDVTATPIDAGDADEDEEETSNIIYVILLIVLIVLLVGGIIGLMVYLLRG